MLFGSNASVESEGIHFSQDVAPGDQSQCGLTERPTSAVGHWTRPNGSGVNCYQGWACMNGRQRSLAGLALDYGGPQGCKAAGFTTFLETEERFGKTGTWYDTS